MMGVAPYAGLKFMTYEGFKTALSKWKGVDERDLPGTPFSTMTYPCSTINTGFSTA